MANDKTGPSNRLTEVTEDQDYRDANTSSLYDLIPSSKKDSCTVTFYTQDTFNEVAKFLQAQYSFQTNSNNTALTTDTSVNKQKVVLTLYKNRKLLIQGAGSWTWRNTVFRDISAQLTISVVDLSQSTTIHTATDNSIGNTPAPLREAQPDRNYSNGSPLNLFNKVFINIRNPRLTSMPEIQQQSATKGTPQHTTSNKKRSLNASEQSSPVFNRTRTVGKTDNRNYQGKENAAKIPDIVLEDEITFLKQQHNKTQTSSQTTNTKIPATNTDKEDTETSRLLKDELEKNVKIKNFRQNQQISLVSQNA